jgi:hypothetical protein
VTATKGKSARATLARVNKSVLYACIPRCIRSQQCFSLQGQLAMTTPLVVRAHRQLKTSG